MTGHLQKRVVSFLETISIAETETRCAELLTSHFTRREQASFKNKPIQSIAGQLALKTAVCRLADELLNAGSTDPRSIEICRDENGAPNIIEASTPDREINEIIKNEIFVSISHSRETAVGLAVLEGIEA
jgi:phosphopantetheinyl transferase (holo-ACP synthase)